jgi:hypothetical protein
LGAVAIKNSVYVIPYCETALEDFQWVLREIVQGGGEASICSACFIEGLSDDQVEAMFRAARDSDYGNIVDEAQAILDAAPSVATMTEDERSELETVLNRLRKRLSVVSKIDFFAAPGLEAASKLLAQIESRLEEALVKSDAKSRIQHKGNPKEFKRRTWVTRRGVYADRLACVWLIRKFIDHEATFKFVSAQGYRPKPAELRFDMFEGEFTHRGDLCSFEVLLDRFGFSEVALREIARIVHDIDCKDAKFGKPESPGIAALLDGIVATCKSDEARVERGLALFDDLYEYFRRK